jgi:hypothetical protein
MPETCRGLRHNKVIVKVNVYSDGYVIVFTKLLLAIRKARDHLENVITGWSVNIEKD